MVLAVAVSMPGYAGGEDAISAQRRPAESGEALLAYFSKPPLEPKYIYYIQPGDLLAIRWIDGPELSGEAMQCEVSAEGKIRFPYVNEIFVAGLTADELAAGLGLAMKKYFATPQFWVIVARKTETMYVSGTYDIYGEVAKEGKFKMSENLTVSDAILNAGGFTEFASKNKVTLIRTDGNEKKKIKVKIGKLFKTGDRSLDTFVQEGDIILVPESWF